MRSVIEKGGLLDKLTFQGGTSLRLCYGGNRFSEDLDFAGGKDFSSAMLLHQL
ncbi:nucleotidyl transferase AbiEii/AbiGii toxin family protein [Shewanella sp. MEBiC00475]|uniref:nucleotidyl transferase AbiEii/AbiGii toxin family protein n=1 Tax=Shewanella sp. MEBiC00475 TaxID=2575361 RepID=UPI0020C7C312|nr:nucleotidyl transferase AbiEii/AbiGii toxin family protein [Shewanella sp. MEBiC00475]